MYKSRYIIFTQSFFTERDWSRFGCQEFKDSGYDIICVEVAHALNIVQGLIPQAGFRSMKQVYIPENLEILEKFISDINENDIVFMQVILSNSSRPIFRLLTKYNVNYFVASLAPLPLFRMYSCSSALSLWEYLQFRYEDTIGFFLRLIKLLSEISFSKFEYFYLKRPFLWLTAGTAPKSMWAPFPGISKAIRVSVPSYDCATASIHCSNIVVNKARSLTAVFLDEGMTCHPDYRILNLESPATSASYWSSLECLFESIEKKFNLDLVVALHPKSRDADIATTKRRYIQDNTANLVSNSVLVLCHASTSVSFAVLYRKPLVFITTNEIEKSYYRGAIARMSSCFNSRRINADFFSDDELTIPPINEKIYRNYEETFLRTRKIDYSTLWEALMK